jgi:hypothetical protein
MITILTVLVFAAGGYGDFRVRAENAWPDPAGITQNKWQGSSLVSYQRLRFRWGMWSAVFITEKDQGEQWADLATVGVGYTSLQRFTAAAGWLQVQFAHGLLLSHPGPWSGGDPLELSKTPAWRLRLQPAESPGISDARPLTGAAVQYMFKDVMLSAVAGWSRIDSGASGLHRSFSETQNRGIVNQGLAAARVGWSCVGISFASVCQAGGSAADTSTRAAADFVFETENSSFTGEVATDFDSTFNFVVSAGAFQSGIRHALTVSRYTGSWARSSGEFGASHLIGAGYGLRWHAAQGVTLDAGALVLDREEEDTFKAGVLLTERIRSRTSLTQRLKLTATQQESTLRAQVTAAWTPYPDFTLSLKVPAAFYRSRSDPDEKGTGVEVRLKHSPVPALDITVSTAASSTDGWNSRVYAYSLSFPGEFGSKALYNSSVLLQAEVSVHISDRATLRAKAGWFNMRNAESIGGGSSETQGASRTTAGMQLDWEF